MYISDSQTRDARCDKTTGLIPADTGRVNIGKRNGQSKYCDIC